MKILGHETLIRELTRRVEQDRLSHGHLLWGEEYTGKKTLALGFARFLETGTWEHILDARGNLNVVLYDALLLSPDEKRAIGIDAIRAAHAFLISKPFMSAFRTVIVDDAHRLTREAQDALLKTAEGPRSAGLLILISPHPDFLVPTLRSRLEETYVHGVSEEDIRKWLTSEWKLPGRHASELAARACGGPGRAIREIHDERYKMTLHAALRYCAARIEERRSIVRELLEDEMFNFEEFLDACIVALHYKRAYGLWHELLALRDAAHYYNLNPRIQLMALGTKKYGNLS